MEGIFKAKLLTENAIMPMAELAAILTPEVATNASALVDEAERYMMSKIQMKAFPEDAFAQMMVANANASQAMAMFGDKGGGEGSGESGKSHDVVLFLNERELGRAMEVYMNKRINLQIS